MILKASKRSGGRQLGAHLLKTEENEHVEIHEVSGFISDTVNTYLPSIVPSCFCHAEKAEPRLCLLSVSPFP